MRHLQLVWFLLSLLLFAMTALAHQPRMVTGDTIMVEKPEVSQAFYAELHGSPQTYEIVADRAFDLYLQLTVPKVANAKVNFTVRVLRDNHFLHLLDGTTTHWKPFYEPFAGDTYLQGPEYEDTAASAGHYKIVVSSPDNRGKYVLAIGKTESFTLADWVHVLTVLP